MSEDQDRDEEYSREHHKKIGRWIMWWAILLGFLTLLGLISYAMTAR